MEILSIEITMETFSIQLCTCREVIRTCLFPQPCSYKYVFNLSLKKINRVGGGGDDFEECSHGVTLVSDLLSCYSPILLVSECYKIQSSIQIWSIPTKTSPNKFQHLIGILFSSGFYFLIQSDKRTGQQQEYFPGIELTTNAALCCSKKQRKAKEISANEEMRPCSATTILLQRMSKQRMILE